MGVGLDALDAVAERLEDADGGIFCPSCTAAEEVPLPIEVRRLPEASLEGTCPRHGRFSVDVWDEWVEERRERVEDIPYQQPHDLL